MKYVFFSCLSLIFLFSSTRANAGITLSVDAFHGFIWNTSAARVFIKGKIIESKDLRSPLFEGFFGSLPEYNLGTFSQGKDRCEFKNVFYKKEGKSISFSGKQIYFPWGSQIDQISQVYELVESETHFNVKALFKATGFEVYPRTDHLPTEVYFSIYCRGDGALGEMLSEHLKNIATVY